MIHLECMMMLEVIDLQLLSDLGKTRSNRFAISRKAAHGRPCFSYRPELNDIYWSKGHLLAYSWSRVLLEKPTGSQLVKKFPAFYVTQIRFITAHKSAHHLSPP